MKRVKLELDSLEKNLCFENEYGIGFGDIFVMWYQGIYVFFYVCRSLAEQVCVFELANKRRIIKGKKVQILCPGLKPTRSPKIITKGNCWYKSMFWVTIKDSDHIIIPIDNTMPIYHKVKYPYLGYCEATKIPDEEKANGVLNYYWEL